MRWQNEETNTAYSLAKANTRPPLSSAIGSPPKMTNQTLGKGMISEAQHEHKWIVTPNRWQCEICGRTYG
jgi:hypothetical protein